MHAGYGQHHQHREVTLLREYRHRFPVTARTFWTDIQLREDYARRTYIDCGGCSEVEVLAYTGDFETGMKRHLRVTRPSDAPGPIRKLMGETTTLEEFAEFDPARELWSFRIRPPVLADRLKLTGSIRVEPVGDAEVEMIAELACDFRIFGIGALFERYVTATSLRAQEEKARFTHDYIRERALVGH